MVHKILTLIFVATICMVVFLGGVLMGTTISAVIYPIILEEEGR